LTSVIRPPGEVGNPPSLLSACAAKLLDAASTSRDFSPSPPDPAIVASVRDLVAAIEAIRGGRHPEAVRRSLDPAIRRAGLLRALRRVVLRESLACPGGEYDPSREALEIVNAIDRLGPSPHAASDDSATLSLLLEEPDACQLLVEVAHDLRSPLTSIIFLSEALRAGFSGDVNELQRRQLGLIYSAALALQATTSDLVDLRPSPDGTGDPPAPLSIRSMFGRLRDLVQPVAEEKGLELRFSAPDGDRYIGRSLLLGRVLLNLVVNALKFTEDGYVEVDATPVGRSRLRFSVRDTGRGMDKEKQEALFEPFKKSDNQRGYFFSGSGLGLTIVRQTLESMDSELHCESRPGWGTRFHFELNM
jgi:signal transduction histidine kinase